MSKPYSDDLRIRAVSAVAGGLSRHKASEVFSVGVSSVIRWVQQHEQTGSVLFAERLRRGHVFVLGRLRTSASRARERVDFPLTANEARGEQPPVAVP